MNFSLNMSTSEDPWYKTSISSTSSCIEEEHEPVDQDEEEVSLFLNLNLGKLQKRKTLNMGGCAVGF